MKKICIIGHFGFGQTLLNGQTIKTKVVAAEIEKQFGADNVILLDLAGGIKKIPGLLIKIPSMLCRCDYIIMMPVENGLRFLTPLLCFWNLFFKKELHYVVIGGWLPDFIANKSWLKREMKKFDGIYVETNTMKSDLGLMGIKNVLVMPNCKPLNILKENELIYPEGVPYRLCTFSRVMQEKGIEDAVNAVRAVNEQFGREVYTLDIYGQVDVNQTEWFDKLKSAFPKYVCYGGMVPADHSVEVLKKYFMLLFPTYYEGEGFAGTLIDAYSAGVPVIATDWKYNAELVTEQVGYTYPTGNQLKLIEILKEAAANPSHILSKKKSCVLEADKYRIEKVIQVLLDKLGGCQSRAGDQ